MRLLSMWLLVVGAFIAGAATTTAQAVEGTTTKIALVIGNANYQHATPLKTPARDAEIVADALTNAGFDVLESVDVDYAGMQDVFNRFAEVASEADIALVYYSGHAIQAGGKNYLLPVDGLVISPTHLKTRAFDASDLVESLQSSSAGILLLDASRPSPIPDAVMSLFTDGGWGLAETKLEAPREGARGVVVGYSAEPQRVAPEGDETNGPYATALAKRLAEPDAELNRMLEQVREDVMQATGGKQRPWQVASLEGELIVGGEPFAGQTAAAETESMNDAAPADTVEAPLPETAEKPAEQPGAATETAAVDPQPAEEVQPEPAEPAAKVEEVAPPPAETAAADPKPAEEAAPKTADEEIIVGTAPAKAAQPARSKAQDVGTQVTEAAIKLRSADRMDIQRRLQALGYYSGKPDGDLGARTRTAIARWQTTSGYHPTTYLTTRQRDALVAQTASLTQPEQDKPIAGQPRIAEEPAAAAPKPRPATVSKAPQRQAAPAPERPRERARPPRPNRQAAAPAREPRSANRRQRMKTCNNVWGSFQVPVGQRCSTGADNVYNAPPRVIEPSARAKPAARPRSRAKPRGKWKMCNNVWGTYQVRANQSCNSHAGG